MKVQIIFEPSGRPKIIDVEDVYTKGRLICFQYPDGRIVKYPEGNIWSITHEHQPHAESERQPCALGGEEEQENSNEEPGMVCSDPSDELGCSAQVDGKRCGRGPVVRVQNMYLCEEHRSQLERELGEDKE